MIRGIKSFYFQLIQSASNLGCFCLDICQVGKRNCTQMQFPHCTMPWKRMIQSYKGKKHQIISDKFDSLQQWLIGDVLSLWSQTVKALFIWYHIWDSRKQIMRHILLTFKEARKHVNKVPSKNAAWKYSLYHGRSETELFNTFQFFFLKISFENLQLPPLWKR